MNFKHLILDLTDPKFPIIKLNRPDVRNAFDEVMIKELRNVLKRLKDSHDVRAIFLQGEGKAFSAGADIGWMQRMVNYTIERNYEDAKELAMLMSEVYNFPLPMIAIVHGAAIGGGVGLVAACDIALVREETIFALSEVKLGLIPAVISPYVLNAIGERAAHRYFLTGERFSAQTAKALGLAHELFDNDSFEKTIRELKVTLSQNSPIAMREAKALIQNTVRKPITPEMIDETISHIANMRVSETGQEGLNAFLQKRLPTWVKVTTSEN